MGMRKRGRLVKKVKSLQFCLKKKTERSSSALLYRIEK